ncbi:hypothetical protein SFC07_04725 [Corynebacterium callunae]
MPSAQGLNTRTGRRRKAHLLWAEERGSVSIEAALALSAMVVVCALSVAALATLAAYLAATDAAGAAARAYAIGEDFEPVRGSVHTVENAGLLTATVTIPAPFGEISAHAIYPVED